MHGIKLLEYAMTKNPNRVLDIGVGRGHHARSFISNGAEVVGIDVKTSPFENEQARMLDKYTHQQGAFELLAPADDLEPYDMVFCCHTLEHMPNVQFALVQMSNYLADDGWLCLAVPTDSQDRIHVGHLTLWTPALLIYNLICAGWDCKEAEWYTQYCTIGLIVQKKRIQDMSWRTGMPNEQPFLNMYAPVNFKENHGAWWANNWPVETKGRVVDPPLVTAGVTKTNLPPKTQLAFGPNPNLRKLPHDGNRNATGDP